MARYLIHSCNERQWYVEQYLIPSMLKQGIQENDITIYQDKEEKGCLDSCMHTFLNVPKDGGTWHLQDDVVIASNFKEMTERYDYGLVCGICTQFDGNMGYGMTDVEGMWYSFPCIRIPNKVARRCAKWYYNESIHDLQYRMWIRKQKYDDSMFRRYLELHESKITVLNLYPNIVNHIDYLIGGSVINKIRDKSIDTMAKYWIDDKTLQDIEKELKEHVCP